MKDKKITIIVKKICEINQENLALSVKICKIYGKENENDLDDKVIAIGYVKNKANTGYYSHTIYEYENGKIVYESQL